MRPVLRWGIVGFDKQFCQFGDSRIECFGNFEVLGPFFNRYNGGCELEDYDNKFHHIDVDFVVSDSFRNPG